MVYKKRNLNYNGRGVFYGGTVFRKLQVLYTNYFPIRELQSSWQSKKVLAIVRTQTEGFWKMLLTVPTKG